MEVEAAIADPKGQSFFIELIESLDALAEKYLIADELVATDGSCCAIGAVCIRRKIDTSEVDPEDADHVAKLVGINELIAREVAWQNDEGWWGERSDQSKGSNRWSGMRRWAYKQLSKWSRLELRRKAERHYPYPE